MTREASDALSRILSARAAALGFANACDAGGSAVLDRVRRGACLGCAVAVPSGEAFPPSVCGCGGPISRAEAAARHRGYVAGRILAGWCPEHAATVPKGRHRPKGCRACQLGLPNWRALLAEASAADFFARHPVGHPLPKVPRTCAEAGGTQAEGLAQPLGPSQPLGRAVLEGPGAPVASVVGGPVAAIAAEVERLRALKLFQRHRMTALEYAEAEAREAALLRALVDLLALPPRRARALLASERWRALGIDAGDL